MKRSLVSFQGECPLKCKHCYTTEFHSPQIMDIETVVASIKGENPDIIYVSHDYENFADQEKGIELCEKLFEKYNKHLMIITRMVLESNIIHRLKQLYMYMQTHGKTLLFSESIFALESYRISECCAPPEQRIETINRVADIGIPTILMLRPVFPKKYVKLEEYLELINRVKVTAVVTSGLIVTDRIIEKLEMRKGCLRFSNNLGSEYLSSLNPEAVHYVDVSEELNYIEQECKKRLIPCYRHSMEAVEHIIAGKEL